MKKAISIAVVIALIVLIFCGPLAQKSNAFAATAVVIGAVIAIMAASGIALVATSGLTASQLKNYVGNKLDEWATSLGQPLDHLINSAGIGMTISGLLTIGTASAQGINDFINWFVNDESLQDNSNKTLITPNASIMKLTDQYQWICQDVITGRGIQVKLEGNGDLYCVAYHNAYIGPIVCGEGSYSFRMWRDYDYTDEFLLSAAEYNAQTQLYYSTGYGVSASYGSNTAFYVPVFGDLQSGLDYVKDKLDAGSLGGEGGLTVRTGTVSIPVVGSTDKYFVDVTGVIPGDTVADATDQIVDNVISGVQTVQDVVVDESEPEYEITGPVAISGLAQVFPFCIPFDIYNFLAALAADPEAPCFEWRFYVPGICDETLVIDLSVFNTVAQILRTMELLAFIVGLAFVTRSRFIRS